MELLIHHSFILDLKNLNQKLNFNFLKGKISTSTYLGPEDPSLLTRFEHLHTFTALFRPFLLLICSTEMHLQGAQQNCSHLVIFLLLASTHANCKSWDIFEKFLWLSCSKFPGLLKKGQKFLCMCSRARENVKKQSGANIVGHPVCW